MKVIRFLVLISTICLWAVCNPATVHTAIVLAADEPVTDNGLPSNAWGYVETTWDPQLEHPSFVRGQMALPASVHGAQVDRASAALAFLAQSATVLGIEDVHHELVASNVATDQLGFSHITLQQVYAGIEVYQAQIKIHINERAGEVVALSNGFIPHITLPTLQPQIDAEEVVAVALQLLPRARLRQEPTLIIYPGIGSDRAALPARLAWLVDLVDSTAPAHNLYLFDAGNGELIDVLNQLYEVTHGQPAKGIPPQDEPSQRGAMRLATYNAHNTENAPGELARIDDEPLVGDADTDNAHDFANVVYDYYKNIHNRNSYDDQGAVITSTVHYGESMQNAFWSGEQMIYGDGFPVLDVVGHELTHAVIDHTAHLIYRWQSGALSESMADIFGMMVDREDWLLGEDLADRLGQAAIRDMENPARFGQPGHTDGWVKTCSDEEGVHINSGIFNQAYYQIATALGKEKAETIFYRALTIYLAPTASFTDARAAVLQATDDLYTTIEYDAVVDGFETVGMSSTWQPPFNDCECSIDTSLDPEAAATVSATLYPVRDTLMSTTGTGRYYTELYYEHTAQISLLLTAQPALRAQAAHLLQIFSPGFQQLTTESQGTPVLTAEMVTLLHTFLADLTQAATTTRHDDLAQTLIREQARINWQQLPGMTFAEAWAYLNERSGPYTIYLPNIQQ